MAGIKEEKKIYLVGIYCRLSKDDGTDNESASIATQKSILTDYVKKQGCLIWEQIAVMTPHANIFVIILIKLSWEIRLDLQSVFRQIMPIKNGT